MSFFEFPRTRTYDSDLGWLIKNVKSSDEAIAALEAWKESAEGTINDLQVLLDNIEKGVFPAEVEKVMIQWLSKNAETIIGRMVKNVWFGLTDSGHFVAYIPDSWSDIIFKTTGYDYITANQPEFGHLVLGFKEVYTKW